MSKTSHLRFNKSLYDLRIKCGWTQDQMGKACGGYDGHTVGRVESGVSEGKVDFWRAVQKRFAIPDSEMWSLINGDITDGGKYATDNNGTLQ